MKLSHIKPIGFSEANLCKLLAMLRNFYISFNIPTQNVKITEFDQCSFFLKTKSKFLMFGSNVGFDLLRTIQGGIRSLEWNTVFQCGYLKTIIFVRYFAPENQKQVLPFIENLWKEWPTFDIKFHKYLRSAVQDFILSKNVYNQY